MAKRKYTEEQVVNILKESNSGIMGGWGQVLNLDI